MVMELVTLDLNELLAFIGPMVEPPPLLWFTRLQDSVVCGLTVTAPRGSQRKKKRQADEGWINGGFLVFEPEVLTISMQTRPV